MTTVCRAGHPTRLPRPIDYPQSNQSFVTYSLYNDHHSTTTQQAATMPPLHSLTLVARSARPTNTTTSVASLLLRPTQQHHRQRPLAAAALFSTSPLRAALPLGPPPVGYRMAKPARWHNDGETALDKAGHYFLMTEMLRGMWVVLEQFFRAP